MVSAKLLVASALALASPALAVYRIAEPNASTVWQAGSTVIVKWYDDQNPPVAGDAPVEIILHSGTDINNLDKVVSIGSYSGSTGSVSYTVPATFVDGSAYAVSVSYSGVQNFSHYFSVRSNVQATETKSDATETASATKTDTATSEDSSATETSDATATETETSKSSSSVASSQSSKRPSSTKASKTASDDTQETDDGEEDSGAASTHLSTIGLVSLSALSAALVARC